MIAQLPMYDWPEVHEHADALWEAVRTRLIATGMEVPDLLDRDVELRECWNREDLVLGQTCGIPLVDSLRNKVEVVGQFNYAHAGCPAGHYRSVVVARRGEASSLEDLRGSAVGYNSDDSQSGYWSLIDLTGREGSDKPFFGATVATEGHRNSVIGVADGTIDTAAIDVLSWELARRYEPDAFAELVEVTHTRPTPSPPLITAKQHADLVDTLGVAIAAALAALGPTTRSALGFHGFVRATPDDYRVLEDMRRAASTSTLA